MKYTIYKRDGELTLVIAPQPSVPDGPMFIYDGGDTALLFRDWGCSLRFSGIGDTARQALKAANEIRVLETQDSGEVVRDYAARIRIVRDVKSLVA